MEWYLSELDGYVNDAINNIILPDTTTPQMWAILLGEQNFDQTMTEKKGVSPLLSTYWGQTESNDNNGETCYNYYAPPNNTCSPTYHCAAGCVATAMAQIMKYWNYPPCPDLEWNNMPGKIYSYSNNYIQERHAVAYLLHAIGSALEMKYCKGSCESETRINNALEAFILFN